jgi:thymidine phosphorylase
VNALDVIRTKRSGAALSSEQIEWFIDRYTDGTIAHEQASALLMAIYFQGLDADELGAWTAAMLASGERLDLSSVGRPTVDKHSTGGVGDKISLILCPLVAACGVAVPQLSGRGLGHTGGTLDKLEAIPGWRADVDNARMIEMLTDPEIGAFIAAAGEGLAPADRRLYALRDTTGTVASIPLISSSIMSKKIAAGTDALVLDVKVGAGAFMPEEEQARELARTMVGLGTAHGVRTAAVLTDMDQPLGIAAGNGVEVTESVEVLAGGGPQDVIDLTLVLADKMLELGGMDGDPAAALRDGRAMDRWRALVAGQGGDPDAELATAREGDVVVAATDGVIRRLDALAVGQAAWRLGAGRARQEDPVSPTAGVLCRAKVGDVVRAGQPVLELLTDDAERFVDAREALADAIEIGPEAATPRPLIVDTIEP